MIWTTHEVTNQVPELVDYNLFDTDIALRHGVVREGAAAHIIALQGYGARLGSCATFDLAQDANRHSPELQSFDRYGHRVDRVLFHPAWHALLKMGFEQGMHCSAWRNPGAGAHVARAAAYLMHGQIEAGSLCPLTMTSAAIPVLQPEEWFEAVSDRIFASQYDGRDLPLSDKPSMTIGMGMTEKQGGSDLRRNTTLAEPAGPAGRGRVYRLTGHKWFFSAPTSDAHLVLARDGDTYSCFYVPRWLDDRNRNAVVIQRLKNKLGNKSNASAEVEFQSANGILIGEPGKGISTLARMASYTRLDCVLGSTAILRQAVVQALHHARHRIAFGQPLVRQPLMQSVLMDLALESEAATALALRLARAFDAADEPLEKAYCRIVTPAAKFWICKRSIDATAECMEVWGGNGYIEDGPMPRLYREAPVNSIWEGSGNIMCLDVLRAMRREPQLIEALQHSLRDLCGDDRVVRARADDLFLMLSSGRSDLEASARYVAQELVLVIQAGLLRQHSPAELADAFIQSRFNSAGRVYGAVASPSALYRVFDRTWPEDSLDIGP